MKDKMLAMAVKPFMPQIKEMAAPAINNFFLEFLQQAEATLRDGEAYAGVSILKNTIGKTFIVTVAMSKDDCVVRQINKISTDEFINELLKKI